IQPLMVFVVIEQLGLPKEHVSWLLMTNGAAMLIGGGIVMAISKKIAPERLLFIGMLVCGLAIMGVGFSTNLYLTLLLYFIDGLFFPCIHVGINTLILQTTEEKFVGRVNGVLNPMFMGMMVVTMSIAGFLKSIFSIPTIYSFAALFFLLGLLCVIPLLKKDTNLVKSSS
ncbi:MAG TPA: MFS transporter, partial [Massilibacterium sp.]|nr:MFS transporter [Massilibacterium sp.]